LALTIDRYKVAIEQRVSLKSALRPTDLEAIDNLAQNITSLIVSLGGLNATDRSNRYRHRNRKSC
jgi:hypothetical protein